MKPTPHLKRCNRDELPKNMQKAWDESLKIHNDTTFTEIMGNSPHMYNWYIEDWYKKVFYSDRIERSLLELVRLRLANVHGCAFCNRGDRIDALNAGITEEQISSLDNYENGPFTDREKAALQLADIMVLTNPLGSIDKEAYDSCSNYLTDGEMVELGMIMAVLCGMAKFIFAFDMVEKEDYCPFIPKNQN